MLTTDEASQQPPIVILIAHEHPLVAAGLAAWLAGRTHHQWPEGIARRALPLQGCNLEDIQRLVAASAPDMVFISLALLEALPLIVDAAPDAPIVIIERRRSLHQAAAAVRLGATASIAMHASESDVYRVVRRVLQGLTAFTPEFIEDFASSYRSRSHAFVEAPTGRQWDVLNLLATGMSDAEIGHELGLAPGSVRNIMFRLIDRSTFPSRRELTIWAVRQGLGATTTSPGRVGRVGHPNGRHHA